MELKNEEVYHIGNVDERSLNHYKDIWCIHVNKIIHPETPWNHSHNHRIRNLLDTQMYFCVLASGWVVVCVCVYVCACVPGVATHVRTHGQTDTSAINSEPHWPQIFECLPCHRITQIVCTRLGKLYILIKFGVKVNKMLLIKCLMKIYFMIFVTKGYCIKKYCIKNTVVWRLQGWTQWFEKSGSFWKLKV
jgi:hypothetical protein